MLAILLAANSTFQLLGSYKVVDSESFNFYFLVLGQWAIRIGSIVLVWTMCP